MGLGLGDEGEREEVYELLLRRQRRPLAVEEVPYRAEAVGGGGEALGHLAAAEVLQKAKWDRGLDKTTKKMKHGETIKCIRISERSEGDIGRHRVHA